MSTSPGAALIIDRASGRSGTREAHLVYWVLQAAAWGFYFWWQSSGEMIFASVSWHKAATMWGGFCLLGLTLTQLLRWLSKRQAWLELPSRELFIRLAASVLTLTTVAYGASLALSTALYGNPVAPILQAFYWRIALSNRLFNEYVGTLLLYISWIGAYFGVAMIRHRHEVEVRQLKLSEALQAAELRLLKSQLNPHFLFNALNSVRALIAEEPAKAQDAVTHLARTLRYTLAAGAEELVTLARELEMVEDYLAIESLRLAERLRVVRDIEPQATEARIPVMLLQALVENAIKHGIAPLRQGGTLRITARVIPGALLIEVENPRPVRAGTCDIVRGVGLENSMTRLRFLFGPRASLALELSDPERAVARVRVPR
jgi:hypothetical protein